MLSNILAFLVACLFCCFLGDMFILVLFNGTYPFLPRRISSMYMIFVENFYSILLLWRPFSINIIFFCMSASLFKMKREARNCMFGVGVYAHWMVMELLNMNCFNLFVHTATHS